MTKFEYSNDGLWYTLSHKGERVKHLFRLGTTVYEGITIYEIIVGKFRFAWSSGVEDMPKILHRERLHTMEHMDTECARILHDNIKDLHSK